MRRALATSPYKRAGSLPEQQTGDTHDVTSSLCKTKQAADQEKLLADCRNQLTLKGFCVMPLAYQTRKLANINVDEIKCLKERIERHKEREIVFQVVQQPADRQPTVGGDNKRLQLSLEKLAATWGHSRLVKKLNLTAGLADLTMRKLFPGLRRTGTVMLLSQPNCSHQAAHLDGDQEKLSSILDTNFPLGVLIGLEKETHLRVWPGGHRVVRSLLGDPLREIPVALERVVVPRKSMLVFRQDLPHAGEALLPVFTATESRCTLCLRLTPCRRGIRPGKQCSHALLLRSTWL